MIAHSDGARIHVWMRTILGHQMWALSKRMIPTLTPTWSTLRSVGGKRLPPRLLVSGLALLVAVASHHWTRALVIVLVSALLLAATFCIGGLHRWRARGCEDNRAAREAPL